MYTHGLIASKGAKSVGTKGLNCATQYGRHAAAARAAAKMVVVFGVMVVAGRVRMVDVRCFESVKSLGGLENG